MQTKLSIQEKLKDERTNRHMTLAQLEEATGISRLENMNQKIVPTSALSIFRSWRTIIMCLWTICWDEQKTKITQTQLCMNCI